MTSTATMLALAAIPVSSSHGSPHGFVEWLLFGLVALAILITIGVRIAKGRR